LSFQNKNRQFREIGNCPNSPFGASYKLAYSGAYTWYQWKITTRIWIQDLFTYDLWL